MSVHFHTLPHSLAHVLASLFFGREPNVRVAIVAMFGVWGTQLDHVIFMVHIFAHDT
jgi:hypothetical protein